MNKSNILDYTYEALKAVLVEAKIAPFVTKQVFDWIYKKHVFDFSAMSNIKKTVIDHLQENFYILELKAKQVLTDSDGTVKFLFELSDGSDIETVVMNFEYGNSICITSQVGCNMGCKFCASGTLKKIRDLSSGEMVAQVLAANTFLLQNERTAIRNIVVMGIGEPFDNYNNLKDFINTIRDDLGVGIGSRKITVSTCGLVDKIKAFTNDFTQVGLAISLHAPTNELRNKIMPINQAYDVTKIIEVAKIYTDTTNRRITFEYILLKGINDQPEHAVQLVKLLQPIKPELLTINLIQYNPVDSNDYERSENTRAFYEKCREYNIITTVRQEKGLKINGACGQLRAKHLKEST